jgi:hypothetical protein
MYTDIVYSAAFCAVSSLITHISFPSSTTIHVSIVQGPSAGVYAVACKSLQCWQTDHTLRIKFL